MLKSSRSRLGNQSGLAIFEIIPVLVIFTLFCSYTYGFFTAIHSGILQSIASRNYAFETFSNRNNLTYFRSNKGSAARYANNYYAASGVRYHAVISDKTQPDRFVATTRSIFLLSQNEQVINSSNSAERYHNEELRSQVRAGTRFNSSEGVNPIWLRIQYGICINATCGAE